MTLGRLLQLRGFIDDGPWTVEISKADGGLILYGRDGEPLALIYAGHDLAAYLQACAPATLFGERQ